MVPEDRAVDEGLARAIRPVHVTEHDSILNDHGGIACEEQHVHRSCEQRIRIIFLSAQMSEWLEVIVRNTRIAASDAFDCDSRETACRALELQHGANCRLELDAFRTGLCYERFDERGAEGFIGFERLCEQVFNLKHFDALASQQGCKTVVLF